MKTEESQPPEAGPEPVAKSAPPLYLRAPGPMAIRLRKPVIQGIVAGGVILLSGALVWAFFIQPELRTADRARKAEAGQLPPRGPVRPTEAVTDQPATYDRLPPPRQALSPTEVPTDVHVDEAGQIPVVPVRTRHPPPEPSMIGSWDPERWPRRDSRLGPLRSDEDTQALAIRSRIVFEAPESPRSDSPAPVEAPVRQRSARDLTLAAQPPLDRSGLLASQSPYELKAGTLIPAALLTAMDTSRSGPVVAVVTQNIFDTVTGTHLLVPQGSRLIGTSGGDTAYGENRAFVAWERLILPNGKSLRLAGEPAVDAQGAVGLRGQVDRRIGSLLVGTLFAGAITTLGQAAREERSASETSLLRDAGDAAAIEASRVAGRLVDRELQVRPSIRLKAGSRLAVLTTRDLVLESYAP